MNTLAHLDGAALHLAWGLPFAGILLSIALLPLAAPRLWHHHFDKIAVGWALAFLVPAAIVHGPAVAGSEFAHVMLAEFLPFLILIGALFIVTGGIRVTGNLVGTPETNLALLTCGTVLASVMGTTGAAMLLIAPLIRANAWRTHVTHIFVFHIFLVANIGGALTPIGDPPLFLGYLKGVDFFWTLQHLALPTAAMALPLLGLFYLLDRRAFARETATPPQMEASDERLGIEGGINLMFLAGIVGGVLLSGAWRPGVAWTVFGTELHLQDLARGGILIACAGLSLAFTRKATRVANGFTWGPIREVGLLFFAIFVTIVPVVAIMRAGEGGAASGLVGLVNQDGRPIDALYFWIAGALSSVLDNAPTYLVFFNMAGGDAERLMHELTRTLVAISAGAVFMGANTYIGNAPNFMVKAIAEAAGIRMPSFFGYVGWAFAVLIPLFVVQTLIFFR